MKLLLYLFLDLILIYDCVCYEIDSDGFKICRDIQLELDYYSDVNLILIINNDTQLAAKLKIDLKKLAPNTVVEITNESYFQGVEGTIEAVKLNPDADVVNLQVDDFYKYNYNYILRNGLNYGGDIRDSKIETSESLVINTTETNQKFEIKNQTLGFVKLFTIRGKVELSVYEYIHEFQANSKPTICKRKLHTVLICYDGKNKFVIRSLIQEIEYKLTFKISDNCKKEMEEMDLLAVIAPKSFKPDYEESIPIIYYSNPVVSSLQKNLISLTSSNLEQVYRLALLQFLNTMHWKRVAIISDNYESSLNFERGLVSFFNENGITFTVFRCMENKEDNCDFIEVLKKLIETNAQVIIENINEKNKETLSQQIRANMHYNFTLIRNGLNRDPLLHHGEVISIHLTAINTNNENQKFIDRLYLSVEEDIIIKSILEIAFRVKNAYLKFFIHDYIHDVRKLNVYRKFVEAMDSQKDTRIQVNFVRKENDMWTSLASILFDGVKIIKEKYELPKYVIQDVSQQCVIRSNNFFKPCDDLELIFLMFVIVVFLMTIATVVVFFSEKHIIHGRRHYRNL